MSPEESRTRREQQQKAIERLSKPVIHATEDKNMETVAGGRKLDAEACEKMVTRLSPSGDIQDQKLQKLVAGVYKYEEPKRLPDSRIQENVERLTKFEMDQRKQKVERLEAKYYQVEPPKTLPRDVLDEHINRMYEATRLTEEKQKRLEAKSAYKPPKSKRITADEMADLGSRLCKPKTTDWRSHDMYGATHGM
jgi:hypothetical protein